MLSRRTFLASACAGVLTLGGAPRRPSRHHRASPTPGPHPEPRPGVDASKVLTAEALDGDARLIELYDGIRAIPHIADGIRCQCGCADVPGYYSLLTCYEEGGMAIWCEICQTEGRMVARLHNAGRTLDQIRAAVDARF